ncbi:hypothetical protein ACJJIL_19235 [Microbulbifer sp. EKSA005]|uniref:hypothetical protein n=1 Tax=Microbulbifer sp. EKSA005 TaxID=3243364 RepID=UPI004042D6FE
MTTEHAVSRRSAAEVEKLKQDWKKDPCWDLYDTEGFEANREELEAYQHEQEQKWQQEHEQRQIEERKALYGMGLGESIEINGRIFVRVPGGWVLETTGENSRVYGVKVRAIAAVLIPFSNEFTPHDFTEENIDGMGE